MAVAQQSGYGARPEPADPQLLALKVPPHSIEAEQSLLGALLLVRIRVEERALGTR